MPFFTFRHIRSGGLKTIGGADNAADALKSLTHLPDMYELVDAPARPTTTTFEVWYMKPAFFRDGICGAVTTDLGATHVHLKDVVLPGGSAQLERVFHDMQGEIWSPNGEAFALIRAKGLQHTSMSVGDVIVVDGEAFVVSTFGFKPIETLVFEARGGHAADCSCTTCHANRLAY